MKAILLCSMVLVLASNAARAANPSLPLINNNVTVDGIVVGADIGGAGTVPPSCPANGADKGWGGILGLPVPLAVGTPGTKSATMFLAAHAAGANLDKVNVGIHIENTPDFTTNDRLTIYFQADATKGNWDATNDFALVFTGIGPSAGTPGNDGCGVPGSAVKYYLHDNGNNVWVPQAAVPPGITFATSYDYEQVHDPEWQLWELEIGIDVSALNIPTTGTIGVGAKLYLFEAGVAATTAYHYPPALTPVADSGLDFNPNQGGVTPGTLQQLDIGKTSFDVIVSSIKDTSNSGVVGQFTQLSPGDFIGNTPQKQNHFTADIKFVNPANLGDMSAIPVPNSGNVEFHIMPWNGGFTGDFIMATIPQSFASLGQSITIPTFAWPMTKAQWDATGGLLNSTAPGAHACLKVHLAGFNVDLPSGNDMQQNLTYTATSTIKESFLVVAPKDMPGVKPGPDGSFEYILHHHWDNLAPKYLTGSPAFQVRFPNACDIGLYNVSRGYCSMRLKPGEQKRVLLEITGGVMPNPSKKYKLSAKAGGTVLEPSSGVPPLEIPVKEGSIVSVVSLGLINVNLKKPERVPDAPNVPDAPRLQSVVVAGPHGPNDPNGYTDRTQVEQNFLLAQGIYNPQERIGALIASFDKFGTSFVVGTDSTFAIPKNCQVLSLAVNSVAGQYDAATGEFEVNVVTGEPLTLPTRLTAHGSAANEKLGVPAQMQPGSNLPKFVIDVGQRDGKRLIPTGYVAYAVYESHAEPAPAVAPAPQIIWEQQPGRRKMRSRRR